jgi:hypothetical protein
MKCNGNQETTLIIIIPVLIKSELYILVSIRKVLYAPCIKLNNSNQIEIKNFIYLIPSKRSTHVNILIGSYIRVRF